MINYTLRHGFVDSSSLSAFYWDSVDKQLYVVFHTGTIAGYSGVTYKQAADFAEASSGGRYYNRNIRNKYEGLSVQQGEVFKNRLETSVNIGYVAAGDSSNTYVSSGGGIYHAPKRQKYTVRGYALVEVEYDSFSVADAVKSFKDAHGEGSTVKEVVVSFD